MVYRLFFFSSRRRHTRWTGDWSSDVCSSDLVDGAAYLFCNEYEATLTERKTGWTGGEIVEHVGIRVTTLGADGARVDRRGEPPVIVPAVPDAAPKEPTGAGDAFRPGFLAATAWGLA